MQTAFISESIIFLKKLIAYLLFILHQWLSSHEKQGNAPPKTIKTNKKESLHAPERSHCLLQMVFKVWSRQKPSATAKPQPKGLIQNNAVSSLH